MGQKDRGSRVFSGTIDAAHVSLMRRPSREERKDATDGNGNGNGDTPPLSLEEAYIDENRLHPLGLGFELLEPNLSLVDPLDWFLQPITGNIKELGGVDVSISPDGCRACVSVRGAIGWLQAAEVGDGIGFCWTNPKCKKKPPPAPPPPYPSELPPGLPDPPRKSGTYQVTITRKVESEFRQLCSKTPLVTIGKHFDNGWTYTRRASIKGDESWGIIDNIPYTSADIANCDDKEEFNTFFSSVQMEYGLISPDGAVAISVRQTIAGGTTGGRNTNSHNESYYFFLDKIIDLVRIGGSDEEDEGDEGDEGDPPPPPPPEDKRMNCCRNQRDNDDLLKKIAKAVGTRDFPVTLPGYLNNRPGRAKLTSIPQVQVHQFRANDSVLGSFPLEIEIEDIDPETEGKQKRKIEIENLAEAIAELFALGVKTSVDADNILEGLLRLIPEVLSVKAAGIITQSYAKANADFLGYKGNNTVWSIPLNFQSDLEGAENLKGLFRESRADIKVWKHEGKESLMDYLQRLMFAAGLVKASLLHKDSEELTYSMEDELAKAGENSDDFQMSWERFIELINTDKVFNRSEGAPRPKARDVPFNNPDPT